MKWAHALYIIPTPDIDAALLTEKDERRKQG